MALVRLHGVPGRASSALRLFEQFDCSNGSIVRTVRLFERFGCSNSWYSRSSIMPSSRRFFLRGLAALAGASSATAVSAQHHHPPPPPSGAGTTPPAQPDARALPPIARAGLPVPSIETPDVPKLASRLVGGVKEFHLVAEHLRTEFLPGRPVDVWGFNRSMPGPTVEIVEGDRVRFIVHNALPEPFSMHWHGLEVPVDMDGVPGISQDPIPPGGTFTYEFTVHQHGTFFYHSHMPMQELMGMVGLFIVQPRRPHEPRVDRDFGLVWQGWALLPNNTVPNTMAMEFNWLTINGKAGPATTPLIVRRGERVRVRNVNLSMDHHPLHLHGNTFQVTGTEGGRVPRAAWTPGNTVLVGVAQARDFEFDATRAGDWMLHCHLPHHMMNNMVSMVGPPASSHATGMRPGSMTSGAGVMQGQALSDQHGPALGRTLGVGAETDRAVANHPAIGPGSHRHAGAEQPAAAGETLRDPYSVPGYPQDMLMSLDHLIQKPEIHGLKPGWTTGMMGMMTLIRVLEPAMFDRIQSLRAEAARRA
jgi:manganese oxidase